MTVAIQELKADVSSNVGQQLEQGLEGILRKIARKTGMRRGAIMFLEKNRNSTLALLGISKKNAEIEKQGEIIDGKPTGSWPIGEDHVIYQIIEHGSPFHLCLNPDYMRTQGEYIISAEMEKAESLPQLFLTFTKERFKQSPPITRAYAGVIAQHVDNLRKSHKFLSERYADFTERFEEWVPKQNWTFDRLSCENPSFQKTYSTAKDWMTSSQAEVLRTINVAIKKGILQNEILNDLEMTIEALQPLYDKLASSGINFADLYPDFDTYINIAPILHKTRMKSFAQFVKGLAIGIRRDEELIAVIELDYAASNEAMPLSNEEQELAQKIAETEVPAIILRGAFAYLQRAAEGVEEERNKEQAEKLFDLAIGEKAEIYHYETNSKNQIYVTTPDSTLGKPKNIWIVKRLPPGKAAIEEAGYKAIQACNSQIMQAELAPINIPRVLPSTQNYLITEKLHGPTLDVLLQDLNERIKEGSQLAAKVKKAVLEKAMDDLAVYSTVLQPQEIVQKPQHKEKLERAVKALAKHFGLPAPDVQRLVEKIQNASNFSDRNYHPRNVLVNYDKLLQIVGNVPSEIASHVIHSKGMSLDDVRTVNSFLLNQQSERLPGLFAENLCHIDLEYIRQPTTMADQVCMLLDSFVTEVNAEEKSHYENRFVKALQICGRESSEYWDTRNESFAYRNLVRSAIHLGRYIVKKPNAPMKERVKQVKDVYHHLEQACSALQDDEEFILGARKLSGIDDLTETNVENYRTQFRENEGVRQLVTKILNSLEMQN